MARPSAVIVQVWLVQGNVRGTMILCTSLADGADIGWNSGDLYGKSPRGANVDVQARHVHRNIDAAGQIHLEEPFANGDCFSLKSLDFSPLVSKAMKKIVLKNV